MIKNDMSYRSGTIRYHWVTFFIILIVLSFSSLNADTNIDSLKLAIKNHEGIAKIDARLKLAYTYRKSDFEKSRTLGEIALKEANELSDINLQARASYYLGLTHYHNDKQEQALPYFEQAIKLYKQEGNNVQTAKVLCMIGTNDLGVTGDQSKAIAHFNEALVYARKTSDHMTMAMIYSQLSNIFRMNGAYKQAIEFIYKSKENYEEVGFYEGIAWVLYSVGRIYTTMSLYEEAQAKYAAGLEQYRELPESIEALKGQAICMDELGLTYLEMGNYEKAFYYNQEAQKIYQKIGSEFGMSNALKYKARMHFQLGDESEALKDLSESLRLKKKINDVLGYPGVYNLYGKILKENKDYQAAIDSLNVGLNYAKKNSQKNRVIAINKCLAEIYAETEEFEKAYNYRTTEVAIADSMHQSKATRALTQLEYLYDLEIKEAKIHELQRQKQINEVNLRREIAVRNLLLIILTMTIVFTFFFMKLFTSNKKANERLRNNQEKLQKLNATKDKFTSIIAHDLKSPFNSILGFSSLLVKYSEKADFDKVKEFSGYINDVSSQTYKLLENLLDWSRSQTGRISFNPKAIDIKIPVKNAMDLLYPVAKKKEIEITANVPSIPVMLDENMIHTVLQNLLANAVKYSEHKKKIRIDGREEDGKLILEIKDEGLGIDPVDIPKLFRLDESLSTPGTDGERGTGMGLILSKEFIEKHRGRISVSSKKGEGSCFTIELPL